MHKIVWFAVIMMALLAQLEAQDNKRAIILINGTAYVADLAPNGSILHRYQSVPDYFSNGATDQQIIAKAESQGLNSDGSLELYAESLDSELVPDIQTFRRVEDYLAEGESQYIAFSRDRALLNQKAVDQVRSIADAFVAGRLSRLTIRSFHHDTTKSRTLANNRSKALFDLLTTFGMSASAIDIETPYGAEDDQLYYVYLTFEQ